MKIKKLNRSFLVGVKKKLKLLKKQKSNSKTINKSVFYIKKMNMTLLKKIGVFTLLRQLILD